MNIKMSFNVVFRCAVYEDINSKESYNDSIEIEFNKDTAEKFLLRFYDPIFDIDGFRFMFQFSNKTGITKLASLTLSRNNVLYIVRNLNQIISDVLQGYVQICTMEKTANVMDFDFESAIEDTCVIEEEEI